MSGTVIFAGPSLYGVAGLRDFGFEIRPPAGVGDILRAAEQGYSAIGLIDGRFEQSMSVWHKELLFAISQGICVAGASSIGALRAAECHAFGMHGKGQIFKDYLCGRRTSDADVALLHAPEELVFKPLTVPLVDVDATLNALLIHARLPQFAYTQLWTRSRALHYKQRTWQRMAEGLDPAILTPGELDQLVNQYGVNQKGEDAIRLLEFLAGDNPITSSGTRAWQLSRTHFFEKLRGSAMLEAADG